LKIKISVLWLFYAVALIAYVTLEGFEPGALQQVMDGKIDGMEITPELMLLFAILFLAPLVMAVLSLTLKYKANRWTNITVGTVFVIIQIAALAETLAQPSAWAILMEISKLIAPALILWYAWKWPKQKE
jgi:uncharacterized membrane protein HdeD (DUF308 family)